MDKEKQLEEWLRAPTTPRDAWQRWSYAKIAEATGVPRYYVFDNLIRLVVRIEGLATNTVIQRRSEGVSDRLNRMSDSKIERLKKYRSQEPPVGFHECAVRLDTSLQSVKYHCKRLGI